MGFSRRVNQAECMDDPNCDSVMLLKTIAQFASINRWVSRYPTILRRWILADMLRDPTRAYHLVDLGAGGCDIDVWLLKEAARVGLTLRITACDSDPRIVVYARNRYGHVPGLTIREENVMTMQVGEDVDYVFANHFLHHLDNVTIVQLLQHWLPVVRRRIVFSDLCRSLLAYMGFQVFSLLYRNSFSRVDGLLSIRRGFWPDELTQFSRTAGVTATVESRVPGRLVMVMDGAYGRATRGRVGCSQILA